MFPGVNGFHWTMGHVLFLSIFFTVLTVVMTTVLLAVRRARRAMLNGRTGRIRWHAEFEDLPSARRNCRHELTGEAPDRVCEKEFDCRACREHAAFVAASARGPAQDEYFGLAYPSNRFYHRGHTWVEPQSDGTVTVGIDEITHRIVGRPDAAEMPQAGSRVEAYGPGWRLLKNGVEVRVLSPVDGEVVETGGPDEPFYLRIRPATQPPDLRHLLHGREVGCWVKRELERLMRLVQPAGAQATLADGGVLIHDVIAELPEAKWDRITGELFLDP